MNDSINYDNLQNMTLCVWYSNFYYKEKMHEEQ